MVEFIILFWALLCPNPTHTLTNDSNCQMIHLSTTSSDDDTGGETGNFPPKPPVPPLPPGSN